jgi:hypothetical protein
MKYSHMTALTTSAIALTTLICPIVGTQSASALSFGDFSNLIREKKLT